MIISVVTFFYPDLQSFLNFPSLSDIFPPIGWFALGLIIWLIGFAWNVRKRLNESVHEQNNPASTTTKKVTKSSNQSGGITGNVHAQQVYTGEVHIHGSNLDTEQKEEIQTKDEDYLGKYYPLSSNDISWQSISKKNYGSEKFSKYIQEANGDTHTLPPTGTNIILPSVLDFELVSREEKGYASIKVKTINSNNANR